MGFTMMEIGIILILIAQSLSPTYRLIVEGGGVLLLLCGVTFSIYSIIKKRS